MTASCICTTVTGDVTALLSQSGNVAVEYYYDAFWVIIETTKMGGMVSADDNPFRYSGYFYDSETELYYLNARHYDPSIARFMQEDTYRGSINGPLSLNLYTYCHNEPVLYFDPTGLLPHPEIKGTDVSAAILGFIGFIYDPKAKLFYALDEGCWQRDFGYIDQFDQYAHLFGVNIDSLPVTFNHPKDGTEWRIWLWKGQYGLLTGAEIGVYNLYGDMSAKSYMELVICRKITSSTDIPYDLDKILGKNERIRLYDAVEAKDYLQMGFILWHYKVNKESYSMTDGGSIFTVNKNVSEELMNRSGKTWWLTGFKATSPTGDISTKSLVWIEVSISFAKSEYCETFTNALREKLKTTKEKNSITRQSKFKWYGSAA